MRGRPTAVGPASGTHYRKRCAVGVSVVVQATGHGAGSPINDDQVLIDTSALNSVTVDASAGTAEVGAGSMWSRVQQAAFAHGLLGLSGTSPTVCVSGYIFGGGVARLGLESAIVGTCTTEKSQTVPLAEAQRLINDAKATDWWAYRSFASTAPRLPSPVPN